MAERGVGVRVVELRLEGVLEELRGRDGDSGGGDDEVEAGVLLVV